MTGRSDASSLKCAAVILFLKKAGIDEEDISSYWPISNPPFCHNLENILARRIEHHIRINDLRDRYQSGYRKDHSTETAVIKVHIAICDSLDEGSIAAVVLLDIHAAFDVIDQMFGVYFWH